MMKNSQACGVALLLMVGTSACSDANGPELDTALDEDMALVAADAALEDIQTMNQPFGGAGSAPALMSAAPPRERSRTVTFFDADGNEQGAFDPALTASIHIVTDMGGEVTRGTWSASVERHRDFTISGLLGEETSRIWNGTGSGSVSRSNHTDDAGARSYDMTSTVTIANVVRGLPRADDPYPLSGSITRVMTITIVNGPNGDQSRTRTVVITFDGTQFATLTVNGETFEVDLAAREGDRPVRKRDR